MKRLSSSVAYSAGVLIVVFALAAVQIHDAFAQDGRNETGKKQVNFATEIQPIFAQRCYKCHGPTANEAGLRLNSREDALAELESGDHAVTPGKIGASTVLDRLRASDDDERMPPEGKPLSEAQIAKIETWIQQGADWAEHWAFQKPIRPAIPQVSNGKWVKTRSTLLFSTDSKMHRSHRQSRPTE